MPGRSSQVKQSAKKVTLHQSAAWLPNSPTLTPKISKSCCIALECYALLMLLFASLKRLCSCTVRERIARSSVCRQIDLLRGRFLTGRVHLHLGSTCPCGGRRGAGSGPWSLGKGTRLLGCLGFGMERCHSFTYTFVTASWISLRYPVAWAALQTSGLQDVKLTTWEVRARARLKLQRR